MNGVECGVTFRSGSGRGYECGRASGHEGRHAISDPAPAPERDEIDAEAARLWVEQHDHSRGGVFWQAACPACTAVPAEAFRLGFRAAAPADRDRKRLVDVLVVHQRQGAGGGCLCGGVPLGASYCEHVADVILELANGDRRG